MRQKMNWDDLKLFLALVRSGTVRSAAERLGISHSTVARRIDAMEKKLAVRLLDRLPTGYAVTPAGEDMLQVATSVEIELRDLEHRILGQDRHLVGKIKITMVDFIASNFLTPHLVKFAQKYPEIDIEVEVTYNEISLDNRDADLALRFGQNPPDHLFGRRLLTIATAAYASKTYLKHHDLDNPKAAQWIGFGSQVSALKWVKDSPFPHLPVKGSLVSILVQYEACKAGMGLGMLPCFMADSDPSLERLSPPEFNPNFDLWLLTHRDLRTTARIRTCSDFIAATIKSNRELFEGQVTT